MKIKKPMNGPTGAAPAAGGAAINDRLRLDVGAAKPQRATVNSKAAAIAFSAAAIALALLGILVYTLYQHTEDILGC